MLDFLFKTYIQFLHVIIIRFYISSQAKIGYFNRVKIFYKYISCRQISMEYLLHKNLLTTTI
jgi:hypothetical protein